MSDFDDHKFAFKCAEAVRLCIFGCVQILPCIPTGLLIAWLTKDGEPSGFGIVIVGVLGLITFVCFIVGSMFAADISYAITKVYFLPPFLWISNKVKKFNVRSFTQDVMKKAAASFFGAIIAYGLAKLIGLPDLPSITIAVVAVPISIYFS